MSALNPSDLPHVSIEKIFTLTASTPYSLFIIGGDSVGNGPNYGWSYVGTPVGMGKELDWFPSYSALDGSIDGHGPGWTAAGLGLWSLRSSIWINSTASSFTDEYMNFQLSWPDSSGYSYDLVPVWPEQTFSVSTVVSVTKPSPRALEFWITGLETVMKNAIDSDMFVHVRADIQQLVPDNLTLSSAPSVPDPQTLTAHPRNSSLLYGS